MTNKYGLTTTANSAKDARATVKRWNDGVNRHTLYTACGTTQDGWGLWNYPGAEGAEGFAGLARLATGDNSWTVNDLPDDGEFIPDWAGSPDAVVGRLVDPDLFNWVPISYPASGPGSDGSLENNWQPTDFSMAESIRAGVDEVIRQIKSTPGTFALVGMSQGSAVMSQVLKALLPGGVLASRYRDCIAGVAFGNPCRGPGGSMPGVPAAYGGGVIALPNRVDPIGGGLAGIKTPDWWWEMSITGDFFSSAPIHTTAGPLLTPAIQALFHTPGSLAVEADALAILMTLLTGGTTLIALLVGLAVRAGINGAAQVLSALSSREFKTFFSQVSQRQKESPVGILANWIYEQVGVFDVGASLAALAPVIVPSNVYPNGNPHIRYGLDAPPNLPVWPGLTGLDSNSTYTEIAVAYLNRRGVQVSPR